MWAVRGALRDLGAPQISWIALQLADEVEKPSLCPGGQLRISVIVPAHNEEEFIGECIDSVQGQTHKDVELIVVCDSCTDGTVEVARGRGISPIEVNFSSTGLAQNAGLEVATGDYFTFMGADDYFSTPDSLKILHDRLLVEATDVLSFGAFFGSHMASCYYSPGQPWPNVSFNLFKKSTFSKGRFPDSSYCEDRAWFFENVTSEHSIGFLDSPVYQYRYPRAFSAIGTQHRLNVEAAIERDENLAGAIAQIKRIPIRFDRAESEGVEFIIREALSRKFVAAPTLVFLTRDPVCSEDYLALKRILQSLNPDVQVQFDVEILWVGEGAAQESAWGSVADLSKMSLSLANLFSLRVLQVYSSINAGELESTANNVIARTSASGLPRSHAEALLQVVSELTKAAATPLAG